MVKALLTLVALITLFGVSGLTTANEQTQAFTSEFIRCVKRYQSDRDGFETQGVTASALMNGTDLLKENNDDYWSYMDCITPAVSGSVPRNLPSTTTCPKQIETIGKQSVYLPSGTQGKTIKVRENTYTCNGVNWSLVNGNGNSNADCSSQVVSSLGCFFNLTPSQHGEVVVKRFNTAKSRGRVVAQCKNGAFQIDAIVCQIENCTNSASVQWFGRDSAKCQGNIDNNGAVTNRPASIKYFPSLALAKRNSRITSGNAVFICKNGVWVEKDSLCRLKLQSELVCFSRTVNSRVEYACR